MYQKIHKPSIEEIENTHHLVKIGASLKTNEAALYLGLSPRTLEAYRCKAGGPSYQKLGRSVRYPASELIEWRDARVKNATSEY